MPTNPRRGPERKAMLVLGMHRAGTSALARVLALRGASLPANMLPANEGNVGGYWEPRGVVDLNERILDACDTAWDDPFAPQRLATGRALVADFRDEAMEVIEREYGTAGLIVVKDPRCTLLREFWSDALSACGLEPVPVAIVRPCSDVAASLARRDSTSIEAAAWLYMAYGLETARAVAAGASCLTYAQLTADWRTSTDRIAMARGVVWPKSAVKAAHEVAAYLKPLGVASSAFLLPPLMRDWSQRIWDWFVHAAEGKPRPLAELQDVGEGLQALADGFAPLLGDRVRRQRLVEAERDDALHERDAALRVYQETNLRLQQAHGDHARRQAELESEKAQMRDAYEARHAELESEKAQMRDAYEAQLAESEVEKAQIRDAYEARQAELESQKMQMHGAYEAWRVESESEKTQMRDAYEARQAELEFEKTQMRGAYEAWQMESESEKAQMRDAYEVRQAESEAEKAQIRNAYETQQAELSTQLRQMECNVATLAGERDALLQTYRQTDALLQQAQLDFQHRDREYLAARSAMEASFAEAGSLRREVESIHASHSWRLTAPLRALMRRYRGELPWWPLRPTQPPSRADALVQPKSVAEDDAPGAIAGMQPDSDTPGLSAPLLRSHADLRAFLVEEFGEAAAADAILRIDRFHLPIPDDETRAASKLQCSPEQALEWARDIARRARAAEVVATPDVSIVIPVYNQLPFTLACIDALLAHESRYSFEILVGDDASTDPTPEALAEGIPCVRHVRHAQNLGFVRNCNATAAHARGEYVLFLNNDTLVLPRWLDELIGTLEANPGIGLAGSKLVYPDGRLQECGAIVWRDGSAWNYGRLADPRRPEFGYLRDVDYVSGASIALHRGLWESLGGFDEAFVPAYAEDADLAFRVRDRGLRAVVQPLSQLLHFEGVSSGTDLGSGVKAYQVENLRKLHMRWAHVLAGHRDNADNPELEKERGVAKRALFVDHCTPTPDEDAGSLVAFEVMRAFLAHGYKVTFIPEDNFANMGGHTRDLQRMGIEPIYHPAYSRMPMFLESRDDPFDVIFLHRFGVGEAHMQALRRKYPSARIIFLNADMHHLREMREAEMSGDSDALAQAEQTRRRELGVISAADLTLVHSDFEQALLLRELPQARVALFPLIQEPVAEVAPLGQRDGICFVGGFRHPPNADAIRWFVDEAWPLVLREVPDATLYIAGSHMPPEVAALGAREGVRAVGFVADLATFLDRRRASVAPLRYGAGAKGKVAASLAQGLPAVCTSIATEGMGLEPGRNVLVADDPQGLAGHLVALLRDDARWREMSVAGLAYAEEVTARRHAALRIGRALADLGLGAEQ